MSVQILDQAILFCFQVYSTRDGVGFQFSSGSVLRCGALDLICKGPKQPTANNSAHTETQVNIIMMNTHICACTYTHSH